MTVFAVVTCSRTSSGMMTWLDMGSLPPFRSTWSHLLWKVRSCSDLSPEVTSTTHHVDHVGDDTHRGSDEICHVVRKPIRHESSVSIPALGKLSCLCCYRLREGGRSHVRRNENAFSDEILVFHPRIPLDDFGDQHEELERRA